MSDINPNEHHMQDLQSSDQWMVVAHNVTPAALQTELNDRVELVSLIVHAVPGSKLIEFLHGADEYMEDPQALTRFELYFPRPAIRAVIEQLCNVLLSDNAPVASIEEVMSTLGPAPKDVA